MPQVQLKKKKKKTFLLECLLLAVFSSCGMELLPVLFELVKGILIREGKGFPPAVVKWFMW